MVARGAGGVPLSIPAFTCDLLFQRTKRYWPKSIGNRACKYYCFVDPGGISGLGSDTRNFRYSSQEYTADVPSHALIWPVAAAGQQQEAVVVGHRGGCGRGSGYIHTPAPQALPVHPAEVHCRLLYSQQGIEYIADVPPHALGVACCCCCWAARSAAMCNSMFVVLVAR